MRTRFAWITGTAAAAAVVLLAGCGSSASSVTRALEADGPSPIAEGPSSGPFELDAPSIAPSAGTVPDNAPKPARNDGAKSQSGAERQWVVNGCVIKPMSPCAEADLRHADLTGANLHNASLQDTLLRYAKLDHADLSETYLAGASFAGASLIGADLSNAGMNATDFAGANLTGANLTGVNTLQMILDGATWVDGHVCSAASVHGGCR